MPRTKKHKIVSIDSDSDECVPPTPRSQKKSNLTQGSQSRINDLALSVVRYFLTAWKGHPIKRSDIISGVGMQQESRSFNSVFKVVKDEMRSTFGFEVIQSNPIKCDNFIIVNCHKPINGLTFGQVREDPEFGLIGFILTIIYLSNDSLEETKLFETLESINVTPESDIVFGNVKKLVQKDFVSQAYLMRTEVQTETVKYIYSWGPRAHKEMSKKTIVEFAANIMNYKPEDFNCYAKAVEEEESVSDNDIQIDKPE